MRTKICILIICLNLIYCSTPYQPMSFTGGYKDQYLGNDIYLITVKVNAYTDESTAYEYFHRRANEIVKTNNYTRYEVIEMMASEKSGLYYYDEGTKIQTYKKPRIAGRIKCFRD